MGDFNTDLLVPDSRTRKLLSVVESVNLKFLPLSATHHSSTTDTLIDLILTSDDSLVARHGQHLAPGFSKHDLIFCSYRLRIPKAKPVVLLQRNFSKLDAEKLRSDATQIQWSDMQDLPDINDKVAFLCSNVIKLFDTHAPVRPVKLKHRPTPWINETIRKFMVRRDRAFRRYKISRTEENWSACKVARNRCNQMCRNAKRLYIAEQLELSSPAGTWKFLRSLGVGKPPKLDNQIPFDINTLNNHFASSLTLDSHTKNLTLNLIHNMPTPDIDSFIFAPASPEEIRKIILSIKSKAVGHDNIGRIMVTNLLDILLPAITHIINHSLDSGNFPDLWRKAYVIPLPKISNPSSLNHYRPISILPFLSKVLESIVHRQLTAFLCNGGLLNPYQSGFRAGHSTTTALLKVTEDIRSGMENRMITVLVLIDFSNAFNAVDHDLLLAVLVKSQISPAAVSWFSSYLRGRQQAIRSCSVLSDWSDLSAGVPQGGILSPLLFSIFIDLVSSSLLCSYHLYADDLQLYCQVKPEDLVSAINQLNGDLNSILDWSNRFGILVNPVKCQAIIVGSSQLISNHDLNSAPLVFDGCNIPFSSTVKDLGVTIDENLSWVPQVNSVSRRIFASLHSLLPLKNFLPFQTKRSLAMSLLLPILDYADVCYLDLTEALLNKLERLQNTCIRFIFGLRKYDHVSARLWNDLPESIRKAPSRPLFKSMLAPRGGAPDCICGSTTGGLGLLGLYINEGNVALIDQTLETLTEYCQGPCHENQNCIATHESNGLDIITALILNDINPLGKTRMDLVLELKNNASKLLLAIMESRNDSENNAERILYNMDPKQLVDVACSAFHQENSMDADSDSDDDSPVQGVSPKEVGHNIYILCHQLAAHNKELSRLVRAAPAGPHAHALQYYRTHTAQIEIVRTDRSMEQIVFPIPEICEYLPTESKHRVLATAERDDQGSKVADFFSRLEHLHHEMKWQKKLRGQPLLFWVSSYMSLWSNILFNFAVLINVIVAFFYPFQEETPKLGQHASLVVWLVFLAGGALVTLLPRASGVRTLLASLVVRLIYCAGPEPALWTLGMLTIIVKGIHLVSIMGNQGTLWKSPRAVLGDRELLYHCAYLLFCLMAIASHPFFFSVLLLDIVYREETLLNVMRSVTRNGRSILLTAVLALVLVYTCSVSHRSPVQRCTTHTHPQGHAHRD
ncbi:unnamed protein product [Plutella xylostella]|uniref:(diamondback moth) hypothetical protein n=1 Tax=Plutella xylostella TaxID=51655 RepID=A0A8S4GBS4_PLUXY|nr:unnamed protein product [Plutella xylostella]